MTNGGTDADEAAIEALFDRADYHGACFYDLRHGERSIHTRVLFRRWCEGRIDLSQLHVAVRAVWKVHFPVSCLISQDDWLAMFRQVPDVIRPAAAIRAWRGASVERGGSGMAWTLAGVAGAWDFAVRRAAPVNEHPAVFQTDIAPEAVLAVIHDGEQEIVVDPYLLNAEGIIRCEA